ncbi:NF038132 family protein [Sedimenticola thiotaurini]|nr:NF038132 family protein [Sedimenticola thiotaurini]
MFKERNSQARLPAIFGAVTLAAAALLLPQSAMATAFDGGIPASWTCTGNCGTLGADGDVTTSPEGGDYGWVSTDNGASSLGNDDLNIGEETNGSLLRSGVFSANAGDDLEFYFNYVTSDGTESYVEYGWARLLDAALNPVALLFTARTNPVGSAVPGFDLPPIEATIDPAVVNISGAAPTWSPLGDDSGECYGDGCGYSGWVQSLYTIPNAGNYILEFGVINWGDTAYNTGMAFDGITIAGTSIEDPSGDGTVPAPATLALFAIGLLGLGYRRHNV